MHVTDIPAAFAQMKNDYSIAKRSRLRRDRMGIPAGGAHGDWHIRAEMEYYRSMEAARSLERDDPVIGMGLRKFAANVLLDCGISIQPDTGDPEIDADLRPEWTEWTKDPDQCDYQQEQTLDEQEATCLVRWVVDGDIWPAWTNEGNVQLLEGNRIRTPRTASGNIFLGVQLDQRRRKRGIYITRDDLNPHKQDSGLKVVYRPLRDEAGRTISQVCENRRVSMTRGFTMLNASFDLAEKHDDLEFAKLVQAQVASCFGVIRTLTENSLKAPLGPRTQARQVQDVITPYTEVLEGVQPGFQLILDEGEKFEGFSPNIPNPEFFQHAYLVLSLIAVNLDLPLIALLLDARETNFSGWRGAMDQARLRFRQIHAMLGRRFKGFVYKRWVRSRVDQNPALERAANQTGIDLYRHRLIYPVWPYIEPEKDVKADLLKLRGGLTSPRRLQAERFGRDIEVIQKETVEDNVRAIRLAKEAAKAINKEFDDGQPVHWREVLNLPTPEGTQMALPQMESGDDDPPPPAPQRTEQRRGAA